jgi:hypothetical protein
MPIDYGDKKFWQFLFIFFFFYFAFFLLAYNMHDKIAFRYDVMICDGLRSPRISLIRLS